MESCPQVLGAKQDFQADTGKVENGGGHFAAGRVIQRHIVKPGWLVPGFMAWLSSCKSREPDRLRMKVPPRLKT